MSRKLYIDWLRGVAVLLMINWHVVDAWTRDDARSVSLFVPITYLAGWAAPLFLFLAGVAVALAGAAKVSKGTTRAAAALVGGDRHGYCDAGEKQEQRRCKPADHFDHRPCSVVTRRMQCPGIEDMPFDHGHDCDAAQPVDIRTS